MAVLLVRHAHAGDRERWEGPDRLRPLTAKGRREAAGLVDSLADRPVARILSSPYLRCTQTVDPLAAARALPVEETEDLAEGAGTDGLELVRSLAGAHVVLCTHGDIVLDVLDWLAAEGVAIAADPPLKKGSTWVLAWAGGRYTDAVYLPPPRRD